MHRRRLSTLNAAVPARAQHHRRSDRRADQQRSDQRCQAATVVLNNRGGGIGTLTNTGSLSGRYGVFNQNQNSSSLVARGTIGVLTNSGTISGFSVGIVNSDGTIQHADQ